MIVFPSKNMSFMNIITLFNSLIELIIISLQICLLQKIIRSFITVINSKTWMSVDLKYTA